MRKTLLGLFLLCAAVPVAAVEEIRLWHGMSGALGGELDRLVAAYNASQKRYRVASFFQGPYDEVMADDIQVRWGTRHAPHIVQVNDWGTADMMQSGVARPLWQIMQHSGKSLEPSYLPAVSAYVSDPEGRLLALPFTGSTPVLYYNRDALREAGLDPASIPRTWDEMPAVLGALIEAGRSCALTTAWPAWVLVENMSAWHNQRFATGGNGLAHGARLAFNTRLMVRWISTLSSWHKSGYFTYAGRRDDAERRFASGECAMVTASSAAYPELRKRARFDLGVAQLPYYDDFDDAPQNTLVGGTALWAIAGHSAAAYKGVASFFDYLMLAEVQAEWHQRTGDVPLTAAASELTRKQGFPRRNPAHDIALRQLLSRPTEDSWGVRLGRQRHIRGIIDEELESVWSGTKAPLDALNSAVRRGNLILEGAR
jgi:sn-glycerol 3-phosphate transport system substrate-binding protein